MSVSSAAVRVPVLDLKQLTEAELPVGCPGVCDKCGLPCAARGLFSTREYPVTRKFTAAKLSPRLVPTVVETPKE